MLSSYFELTKPRLVFLALVTTALGFFIPSRGIFDFGLFFHALLGTALVGGGAGALNQWLEKDIDATMERTRQRPLPSGKLQKKEALLFGLGLSVFGIAHLLVFVNALTAILGLVTLISYTAVYTPLKRLTPFNTFVGAVPGAMPVLMGWTARKESFDAGALSLFLILFFWQIPHFFSIAWNYRHDYLKSGLRMPTLSDLKGRRTMGWLGFYSCVLLGVSLGPVWAGISGHFYLGFAILAGLSLVGFLIYLAAQKQVDLGKFATASIVYLVFMVSAMTTDKIAAAGIAGEISQNLPSYGAVVNFTLTERNGKSFLRDHLAREVWVAGFIFTRCAGQCPILSLQMSQLQRTLPKEVRLVSFSVDPNNDTPEILADYARKYGAQEGRWFFLTGSRETIDTVLSSFHMNDAQEPMLHSLRFVLVDGDAQIRGYYDSSDPKAVKELQKHARALIHQERSRS
jgi:protoheme IX farnesyltransferase